MISPMLVMASEGAAGRLLALLYRSAWKGQMVSSSLHWQGAGS